MPETTRHACQCPDCTTMTSHPNYVLHRRMNRFLERLDEQQRRWYVALESMKIGHGGDTLLAQITGLHVDTIRRGREELADDLQGRPTERVRVPGGGRPPLQKTIRR
jgi:hypothetical protein